MPTNDLFYQFSVANPLNPIHHLKKIVQERHTELASAVSSDVREGVQVQIKNIEDFLHFSKQPSQGVISLSKTNVGAEAMGTDAVIMAITKTPIVRLDGEKKDTVLTALYNPEDGRRRNAFFEESRLSNIFLWWERGEVRSESFGTVHDDVFKGFVRVEA